MRRIATRVATLIGALALLAGALAFSAPPTAAQSGCPTPTVRASHAPVFNFRARNAYDGKPATFFFSSHDNWQYLEVDFGCVGTFNGLRRLMSLGFGSTPNRGPQGEGVSFSVDGTNFTDVLASSSTGWESYVNYHPRAWHSVDYGWSKELRLNTPAAARFVRFNWDGAKDFLQELEIDFVRPPVQQRLSVRLSCDVGVVSCQAAATGGSGTGHGFTWTPRRNVTITNRNDIGSVSFVAGTCQPGSRYTLDVSVTDSDGNTATDSVSPQCLAIPL